MITTTRQRDHMVSLKGLTRLILNTATRTPITITVQGASANSLTVHARPVHRRRTLIKQFVLIAPTVLSNDTAHNARLRKNRHAFKLAKNRHSSVCPDSEWSGLEQACGATSGLGAEAAETGSGTGAGALGVRKLLPISGSLQSKSVKVKCLKKLNFGTGRGYPPPFRGGSPPRVSPQGLPPHSAWYWHRT